MSEERIISCKATALGYSRGAASYPPGAPVSVPEHVIRYEEEHHKGAPRIVRLSGAELKAMDDATAEALEQERAAAAARLAVPEAPSIFDAPPEGGFKTDGTVALPAEAEPAEPTSKRSARAGS